MSTGDRESFRNDILAMFSWKNTREGHDFWVRFTDDVYYNNRGSMDAPLLGPDHSTDDIYGMVRGARLDAIKRTVAYLNEKFKTPQPLQVRYVIARLNNLHSLLNNLLQEKSTTRRSPGHRRHLLLL